MKIVVKLTILAAAVLVNTAIAQVPTNSDPFAAVSNAPHPPTSHFSIVGMDDSRAMINISQETLLKLIGIDMEKIENGDLEEMKKFKEKMDSIVWLTDYFTQLDHYMEFHSLTGGTCASTVVHDTTLSPFIIPWQFENELFRLISKADDYLVDEHLQAVEHLFPIEQHAGFRRFYDRTHIASVRFLEVLAFLKASKLAAQVYVKTPPGQVTVLAKEALKKGATATARATARAACSAGRATVSAARPAVQITRAALTSPVGRSVGPAVAITFATLWAAGEYVDYEVQKRLRASGDHPDQVRAREEEVRRATESIVREAKENAKPYEEINKILTFLHNTELEPSRSTSQDCNNARSSGQNGHNESAKKSHLQFMIEVADTIALAMEAYVDYGLFPPNTPNANQGDNFWSSENGSNPGLESFFPATPGMSYAEAHENRVKIIRDLLGSFTDFQLGQDSPNNELGFQWAYDQQRINESFKKLGPEKEKAIRQILRFYLFTLERRYPCYVDSIKNEVHPDNPKITKKRIDKWYEKYIQKLKENDVNNANETQIAQDTAEKIRQYLDYAERPQGNVNKLLPIGMNGGVNQINEIDNKGGGSTTPIDPDLKRFIRDEVMDGLPTDKLVPQGYANNTTPNHLGVAFKRRNGNGSGNNGNGGNNRGQGGGGPGGGGSGGGKKKNKDDEEVVIQIVETSKLELGGDYTGYLCGHESILGEYLKFPGAKKVLETSAELGGAEEYPVYVQMGNNSKILPKESLPANFNPESNNSEFFKIEFKCLNFKFNTTDIGSSGFLYNVLVDTGVINKNLLIPQGWYSAVTTRPALRDGQLTTEPNLATGAQSADSEQSGNGKF